MNFFSGETLCTIFFLVDRHYFLDFFTMSNGIHAHGMQKMSLMQFFLLASFSYFVDGTFVIAFFDFICNPVVGGFELFIVGNY